jgi:hypothetical protein
MRWQTASVAVPGLWVTNSNNPSVAVDYAVGILKTNVTNYAIRVGNA